MSQALDSSTCRALAAFLASTPDHVLVLTTPDGTINAWLGAAERVLGYAADEVIGKSLSILFTPEDRQRGLDIHEISLAQNQGRSEDERWHTRKNGSRFWASGVLTAIRDQDGKLIGLCKLLRDKTDLRMRLQLLEDRVSLRDAEIARHNDFVKAKAHELRNPLMPINSALAILSRPDAGHLAVKATSILQNQIVVLKALIDDLDKAGGAAASVTPLQLQAVNLNDSLRTVCDGIQAQAGAENKALMLILPDPAVWITADPARVQQMLLNLIGNAIKYTRYGGRISVSASIEGDMAITRIEDDGRGISADVLPHIFELFTREPREDGIAGLGIGLAVVKELAEMHGGNVEARSQGQDKGSVFGLRLPIWLNPSQDPPVNGPAKSQ